MFKINLLFCIRSIRTLNIGAYLTVGTQRWFVIKACIYQYTALLIKFNEAFYIFPSRKQYELELSTAFPAWIIIMGRIMDHSVILKISLRISTCGENIMTWRILQSYRNLHIISKFNRR